MSNTADEMDSATGNQDQVGEQPAPELESPAPLEASAAPAPRRRPARAAAAANDAPAAAPSPDMGKAKLKRLVISNFRCIGSEPVAIDLDDIVVLVGPNNAGKSSILDAYKFVIESGSNDGKLLLEDFPNGVVDPDNLPTIEVHTYVGSEVNSFPSAEWLHQDNKGKYVVEKWIFPKDGVLPKKQGKKAGEDDWSNSGPWGWAGVAKPNRPQAHRIGAFDTPEDQTLRINGLVAAYLEQSIANVLSHEGPFGAQRKTLDDVLLALSEAVAGASKESVEAVQLELTASLSKVLSGYQVVVDAPQKKPNLNELFVWQPTLRVGQTNGHMTEPGRQGSGARRTLLWAALKLLRDRGAELSPRKVSLPQAPPTQSNVLLLDEPENCLHPSSIREACKVLYDLAESSEPWQILVTTHSPAFIDLSRDHTTVIRVERSPAGVVSGSTVFRPSQSGLDGDDKENLKLMNLYDPYVAEFFFGGRTVVVEGDTEFAAFTKLKELFPGSYNDVHIVRARGKYPIISMMKILNHFGKSYGVLHDCDKPLNSAGGANSAWPANKAILQKAIEMPPGSIRHLTSVPNFEEAVLQSAASSDKPYHAVSQMKIDDGCTARVKAALDWLLGSSDIVPPGMQAWSSEADIEALKASLTPP